MTSKNPKSKINHLPPHGKITTHLCPRGDTKKKFSISIDASVVSGASLAPLHCRKNSALARRNSMYAKWIPRQTREPIPSGWKAFFAAGLTSLLSQREGRNLGRIGVSALRIGEGGRSKGFSGLLVRAREECRVAVEGVCLRGDCAAGRDEFFVDRDTTGGNRSRQA